MTSPVDFISGPSSASSPGKRLNGSTGFLTLIMRRLGLGRAGCPASRSPAMTRAASRASGMPDRLADERHRARGARVGLEHVDLAAAARRTARSASPRTPSARASRAVMARTSATVDSPSVNGGITQRGVAGVDARLLDVLHDRADQHRLAVGDGVHVHLERALEELVDQHRLVRRDRAPRAPSQSSSSLRVVDDAHAAPAQHVRRPHQHRVAELLGGRRAPRSRVRGDARLRLRAAPARSTSVAPARAVLGQVEPVERRAQRAARPPRAARARELERRLAAELHDHARSAARRRRCSARPRRSSGSK